MHPKHLQVAFHNLITVPIMQEGDGDEGTNDDCDSWSD